MPRWESALPQDNSPHELLANAERYLNGQFSPEALLEQAANLRVHVDHLNFANGAEVIEHHVGNAAASAAMIALVDERFDQNDSEPTATEFDIDPHDWDAAFFASIVCAGGTPANPKANINLRRTFWTWYLDVAVPSVACS
jgi:hypothetical protein